MTKSDRSAKTALNNINSNSPHLKFYTDNKISPVFQRVTNINHLLEYRESLYKGVGISALAIRGSDVLEVAAGSGQNSLFIASCLPNSLTLVDPNPTSIEQITDVYSKFNRKHTKPQLIPKMLEDFRSKIQFDIVVCENWLGRKNYERQLFKKLLDLTKPSGVMITTVISPIGILPNFIRRALSARLVSTTHKFDEKEKMLVSAFSSHLKSIQAMTRPKIDWVQDNMINPGYLDICITLPELLKGVGKDFDVLGCYPRFCQDWRWFKSLHGQNRKFNKILESEYYKWCHGFLSYKMTVKEGSVEKNRLLEAKCIKFIGLVKKFESLPIGQSQVHKKPMNDMISTLMSICDLAKDIYSPEIFNQLLEGFSLLKSKTLKSSDISNCKKFNTLFGRETLYISVERIKDNKL